MEIRDPCFLKSAYKIISSLLLINRRQLRLLDGAIADDFLEQSGRQIAASGGRPIVWVFAEKDAALFTRALFDRAKGGRERITVVYVPWTTRNP